MNKPYNYLFKYIIVGDTSIVIYLVKEMLEKVVYYYNMWIKILEQIMKQRLGLNLVLNN